MPGEDKHSLNKERFDEIMRLLNEEDRKVVQQQFDQIHRQAVRAAISQVMARNNSHNIGPHLGGKPK